MKFENTEVFGFQGAIRGMRNPLESWAKSDSTFYDDLDCVCESYTKDGYNVTPKMSSFNTYYKIGQNDLDLMQRLIKGGPEHRKFLRYIHVQFDMTAPLYLYKEFDTYKIGTVANSTSTMHKLASTPITLECFEIDDFDEEIGNSISKSIIKRMEWLRQKYLETKDVRYWKELIRWLPESWLQTRTIDLNYEVLRTIVHQRQNHKLTEWHQFIDWVHTLPYADKLIFFEN